MKQKPIVERIDVPHRFIDLAQRRTEFLFRIMTWEDATMRRVLASAYLQGLGDAADALDAKAKREAAGPTILPLHC